MIELFNSALVPVSAITGTAASAMYLYREMRKTHRARRSRATRRRTERSQRRSVYEMGQRVQGDIDNDYKRAA